MLAKTIREEKKGEREQRTCVRLKLLQQHIKTHKIGIRKGSENLHFPFLSLSFSSRSFFLSSDETKRTIERKEENNIFSASAHSLLSGDEKENEKEEKKKRYGNHHSPKANAHPEENIYGCAERQRASFFFFSSC